MEEPLCQFLLVRRHESLFLVRFLSSLLKSHVPNKQVS